MKIFIIFLTVMGELLIMDLTQQLYESVVIRLVVIITSDFYPETHNRFLNHVPCF